MTTLPAAGYFSDPTRKNQGAKQGLDAVLAVLRELPGGRAASVAEIQGGAIEPDTALVLLETEGQASADALDLIATTHHPEGRLLLLRPATAGRTITVRHAFQGDGAIHLRDETDLVLDATSQWLLLYRDELDWREIARFGFAGEGGGGGSGEGESNTGANVNANGIGVFEAKVGTQLRFRGIGSTADGKVTVTYDADAKLIGLTVDESALEVPAANITGLAAIATSGDSDDLAEGQTHLLLTPAERIKLAGIEPGAEVNEVASVFGRTGAVVSESGDYDAGQITETASRVFLTPAPRDRIDDALTPDAEGAEIHNYRFKPRDLDAGTTTYTIIAADAGRVIRTFAASAIAITYPSGLGDGFTCQVMKCAAGHPTIAPGSGVSMLKRPGDTITEPGGMASITTRAPDDIVVHGADTDSAA
jgi:hypothetical protein